MPNTIDVQKPPVANPCPPQDALAECRDKDKKLRRSGSMRGAFLTTAGLTPIVALITSAIGYAGPDGLASSTGGSGVYAWLAMPVVGALVNLIVVWGVLALLLRLLGFTSVDRANTGAYGELQDALIGMTAQLACVRQTCRVSRAEVGEVEAYRHEIATALGESGAHWILGSGYINLLRRAHRVEEALIYLQDKPVVIAGAEYDRLRISASTMMNKQELLERLTCAARFLREGAHKHANWKRMTHPDVDNWLNRADSGSPKVQTLYQKIQKLVSQEKELPCVPASPHEALTILRDVRRSINDFRDDRKAGLVRYRNLLCIMTCLTGFALYSMLWLAITLNAAPGLLGPMAGYLLVGVIVGLFARLVRDVHTDTATDDFGLSAHRLVTIPLMSGVAALGGVLIVTILALVQSQSNLLSSDVWMNQLAMQDHPMQILVAGVFGLSPTLLLSQLEQQADQYKRDLRRSEALQQTEPANGAGSQAVVSAG
jgi:hypothetical protein